MTASAAIWMTLAEYASAQSDGSVTLVRAGIDKIQTPLPADAPFYAVVDVEPGVLPSEVPLRIDAISGARIVPLLDVQIPVARPERRSRFIAGLVLHVEEPGVWTIRATAGTLQVERPLTVALPEPT